MSLTLSDVFAALYDFKVECPTGPGRMMNLLEVSKELSTSLTNIFLRDEQGRRAVYGGTEKFQNDPNWRPAAHRSRIIAPGDRLPREVCTTKNRCEHC